MHRDEKLVTCLSFANGQARQAAEFYASVFPDSAVGSVTTAPLDTPGMSAGEELTVEFTVLGRAFFGLNGGPSDAPGLSVSFQVLTEDQADTDRYWHAIVDNGGKAGDCGWCTDRWGFAWQITPRVLMDAVRHPDRAVARRAMEAMMTMQKIDVARIQAAVDANG